ncbi:MAG: beta-propeller domain-containing protein [Clostridiales bacterium]|mgnify:CR=1 FL=1|nr:beta-propeller domain-containing protein [Clostridiales bacterium]
MKKKRTEHQIDQDRSAIDQKFSSVLKETEIPDALKPENISSLIENNKPAEKSKVITNIHFYRLSFALLLIIVMVIPLYAILDSRDSNPLSPDYAGTSSLSTIITMKTNDYDSIYNVVQNLYTKVYNFSGNTAGDDFIDFNSTAQSVQSKPSGNGAIKGPTGANSTTAGTQAPSGDAEEESIDHSTTNEQVKGVNEGDILKTDGKYVYTVQSKKKDNAAAEYYIHIRKIQEDGGLMKVSSIAIENDRPIEMYVDNNRLILLSNNGTGYKTQNTHQNTSVRIYDISDRSVPKTINHFYQQGEMLSSRYIDENLYVVSNYHSATQPVKDDLFSYVPCITYPSKGQVKMVASNDICVMENPTSVSYVVASSVNTRTEDAVVNTKAVLGSGGVIYCSTENLYVLGTSFNASEQTEILKFALNSGKIRYSTKQTISGRTLNQFSADEYNGFFRIATTGFDTQTGQTSNNVYLLDSNLKQVGAVTGLAKGENIYAVRFVEDTGYVVTFRQTDPLFVLNLKDPKNPVVEGALKIPGFSSYLHPFKENLLIGIGANTTSGGRRIGYKLSLFDVSDPTKPLEVTNYVSTNDYMGMSLVEYDAKAFLFDGKQDIIGLPLVTTAKNGSTQNGYALFKISEQNGFEQLCFLDSEGNIISEDSAYKPNKYTTLDSMNSWYSQFNVLRGAYVGDTLYLFTGYDITALNYKTFQKIGTYPCDQ